MKKKKTFNKSGHIQLLVVSLGQYKQTNLSNNKL